MAPLVQDLKRQAAVWGQLDQVTDPELDESVTGLGFIEQIDITDDGIVTVEFRLPTYWCSPNFAFLMADDIRRAVGALSWVREVRPELQDHMAAEELNRGVRLGLSFAAVFRNFETADSLDALRERFQRKAFERRQEAVLLALREIGYDDESLCAMTLATLDRINLGATEGARQKPRYRDLLIGRGLAREAGDLAFVRLDGQPISTQDFAAYLRRLRSVRINMEFNGTLCRGLLAARYKTLESVSLQPESAVSDCGEGCGGGCDEVAVRPVIL